MLTMTAAYFDNAATTFPKPEMVYDYADEFYRTQGANVGRGSYNFAQGAGNVVSSSKNYLRELLGCEGKEIVYTSSATDAINRILLGLSFSKGDAIYVSPFEHNSVTRTLHHIRDSIGVNVEIIPFDKETLKVDMEGMLSAFELHTPSAIVLTHASNVCGAVLPVEQIFAVAKSFGAITILDMSQTAGLVPLRLSLDTIDFAVFAGHKTLYAPFGVGGFVCKRGETRLSPVFFGGNGINSLEQDMPSDIVQMEEIGSQNIYAIAGLKASTSWLLENLEHVRQTEAEHSRRLLDTLRSYANISITADSMECDRIGVVSCTFAGYSPDEIGSVLDELGVAVRTGLHCSPYAHRFLGTLPSGSVRFSVSAMTNDSDFKVLQSALDYIQANS